MKNFFTLTLLMLLIGAEVRATDVCVAEETFPLNRTQILNFSQLSSLSCKTVLSFAEYNTCMKDPLYQGGYLTTKCDRGKYAGCCYRRWNGNPNADWELIRCESIDNRTTWDAFKDLFR